MINNYDAFIIGSGPNGLSAAIRLAQEGLSVVVYEAKDSIGGGCRTKELTLPGFKHDVCSAIHPMAVNSPYFKTLPLKDYELEWIYPEINLAHPFDDGSATALFNSIENTADTLGEDKKAYEKLMNNIVPILKEVLPDFLGPFSIPSKPIKAAHFGFYALQSSKRFTNSKFSGKKAKGFFAGLSAHSILRLDQLSSAAIGFVLASSGHLVGWPIPNGGSQQIVNALAKHLESLGGKIEVNREIKSIDEFPENKIILFDVTPKQLLKIAGDKFPESYKKQLSKFRYNPGSFKIDWALSEPIPWKNDHCRKAGTIHIGGTFDEIAASEKLIREGKVSDKPYIILAQQSLFDETRAPEGKHTAWAYCHVPHGSSIDMVERIENQIERFVPGFKDCIIEKNSINATEFENYNPNYIGGDINGGVQDIWQLFTRPVKKLNPYKTPLKNVYICSSSTPPGGGVHGMCGFHAAESALKTI